MRFMMIVKGNEKTEAGVLPTQQELAEMARYNEELIRAGVMLDGAGLKPTSKGARVRFEKGGPRVIDGPFSEAKEVIAGYWIIEVKSRQEAIEWARRVPFKYDDGGPAEVELRPFFELEDFEPGEGLAHHQRLQDELKSK